MTEVEGSGDKKPTGDHGDQSQDSFESDSTSLPSLPPVWDPETDNPEWLWPFKRDAEHTSMRHLQQPPEAQDGKESHKCI